MCVKNIVYISRYVIEGCVINTDHLYRLFFKIYKLWKQQNKVSNITFPTHKNR